jgi:hypothetical protein
MGRCLKFEICSIVNIDDDIVWHTKPW